jgi:hypothetical protein
MALEPSTTTVNLAPVPDPLEVLIQFKYVPGTLDALFAPILPTVATCVEFPVAGLTTVFLKESPSKVVPADNFIGKVSK